MNILALDCATNTGWAINNNIYGVFTVKITKKQHYGEKWRQFEKWINEMIELFDVQLVCYERPAGRNKHSIIHAAKLAGIVEKVCAERNIPFEMVSASEVKLFATGYGQASKEQMIANAVERLQYMGSDDNEADALWILNLIRYKKHEQLQM